MNTIKAINKSFLIVWKNLIFIQPFILFLLIFTLFAGGVYGTMRNGLAFIIFSSSLMLLIAAFIAGWFYMAKKTIAYELYDMQDDEDEKVIKSFSLIKHFFPGVGKYFLPVVGLGILYVAFVVLVMFLGYKFGLKYIGAADIDFMKLNEASASSQEMQAYFATLPADKAFSIVKWVSYMFVIATGVQFLTMWWFPALFYNTKNPLKALGLGFVFLFRKFGASIGITFFLIVFNFFISLFTSVFGKNVIASLVSFLMFVFYAAYYVVLIFLYYGQNSEHSAKDYINSGDDSDGQKLAGGQTGE